MEWNNVVFFSELISTMFLTFMALQTFYMVKKYKVEGFRASLYNAMFMAIALTVAIVINQGVATMITKKGDNAYLGYGFVNPSAVLLVAIAQMNNNAGSSMYLQKVFMIAILADFLGGILAGVLHGVTIKMVLDKIKRQAYAEGVMTEGHAEVDLEKSFAGEVFASLIFFTTIVFATSAHNPTGSMVPLIVGFGLLLANLATGNYTATVNPAVGLGVLISELINGKKDIKTDAVNYLLGASFSFVMASSIGAAALGLSYLPLS